MVTLESFVFGRPLRGCFCIASPKKANSKRESPTVCCGITALRLPSQCFGTRLSSLRLAMNCWVCCCGTEYRSVVGQSLATGVDAPPGPGLAGLASRLGDVLRPIRERHLNSWADQRISCTVGHGVEKLYSFFCRMPLQWSSCPTFASCSLWCCARYCLVRVGFCGQHYGKSQSSPLAVNAFNW